jgi:hypothetical protein
MHSRSKTSIFLLYCKFYKSGLIDGKVPHSLEPKDEKIVKKTLFGVGKVGRATAIKPLNK